MGTTSTGSRPRGRPTVFYGGRLPNTVIDKDMADSIEQWRKNQTIPTTITMAIRVLIHKGLQAAFREEKAKERRRQNR